MLTIRIRASVVPICDQLHKEVINALARISPLMFAMNEMSQNSINTAWPLTPALVINGEVKRLAGFRQKE